MLDKKNKFILAGVAIILFYFFALLPYLHSREATRVVLTVLTAWTNNDFIKAFDGWEEQKKSPPIYGLTSYKITKRNFYRNDGVRHGQVYALLDFTDGVDALPSGKTWIFELKKTRIGWKITDFHLAAD